MMTMQLERQAYHSEVVRPATLVIEITDSTSAIVVVRLRGQADADQTDILEQQLWWAVRHNPRFVILDLAGLTTISRPALGSLEEFRRQRCWQGSEVWLAGLQPSVWLAFQDNHLDRLFIIRDSVAQVFGRQ
jgi:anti-anti-sigma regulatory factor